MLLRLYRLTDKLGTVLLKILAGTLAFLMQGMALALGGLRGGVWGVILALWRGVRLIARFLWRGLMLVSGLLQRTFRNTTRITRSTVARGVKSTQAATTSQTRQRMVQQQSRGGTDTTLDVGMIEDPLKVQNRALSYAVVILGFVLLAVFIWSTTRNLTLDNAANTVSTGIDVEGVSFAADTEATATISSVVNTPVPTATPIPSILQIRGSLVYVARERGQSDLWVVNVGSSTPLRLTNNPADERDPEWSPDGRRIAYASRRDGNWEIYTYDLFTDEHTRLTYDLSFQANPSWSPDGAFLVYESYQGGNLDLYYMPSDASAPPGRLTDHPQPDFSPAWSSDGRRIAFTSWRDGSQDIYLINLDQPDIVVNLTNTPTRNEDYAAWSPDGNLLAFSAVDEGIEKVFVLAANTPNATPQVQERGRTPTWAPDGASLVLAVDSVDSTHFLASPFTQTGVATEIIPVLRGSAYPNWTDAPLPTSLTTGSGVPPGINDELYLEQVARFEADPPYRLDTLVGVQAPNPVLSDQVNDSFNALREQAVVSIGYDFLGELEDAFWRIDRPPQPGEERRNWHMAGRAFSINRNLIAGFPPPIEVVREDLGVNTVWRVYVRVTDEAQDGQLGEPLRHMPWDFASRNQGDVEAYDQGGRLRTEMPQGYYVDLTQLVLDYGWERPPAGRDWRGNFNSINYWMFLKTDGLDWYNAMREIYTDAQLGGFVPTATPAALNTNNSGS